jgi:hypothetical protein
MHFAISMIGKGCLEVSEIFPNFGAKIARVATVGLGVSPT